MGLILLPLLTIGLLFAAFSGEDDSESDPALKDVDLTEGDDDFEGTSEGEDIRGFAGNDTISAKGGPDRIDAGEGHDDVNGGRGDDTVFLGQGNDYYGLVDGMEPGDDFIRGGAGNDVIGDRLGANTVYGDLGNDYIDASDDGSEPGPDTVFGGHGNDSIFGDDGDVLTGGGGADLFEIDGFYNDVPDLEEETVTITDFETERDSLIVWDNGTLGSGGDFELVEGTFNDAAGTFVVLGETEIAFLAGKTPAGLAGMDITVLAVPS